MTDKPTIDDGGPVYPGPGKLEHWHPDHPPVQKWNKGITLRQRAAIELRVPSSGLDWLDEMIRRAKRDELAGLAMQALSSRENVRSSDRDLAIIAYIQADAMLNALDNKNP